MSSTSQRSHRGADAAPLADIPEVFGRYRILRELGGGGMGTVYLALDTQLDREVALKVPHVNAKTDSEFLERFDREAKTAAKLSHANICQVYDVGEIDGRRFLTMEYISGRPLSKMVGLKSLTDTLAIQMVRLVALAVGAAHKQGIIHRDLKPANIMLTLDGKPKVTDFGLARRVGTSDQRLTQSGMIIGTPAYMPLEQLHGDLEQVGPHSDVYSLGVILYELLTGHLPFDVPSDAPVMSLFAKILTSPPDPPTKHRPELDPRLETIVLKAIAKQHADRYQTMTEFAAALAEYNNARRAGGVSPPVPSATPNAPIASPVTPTPTGGLTPPARLDDASQADAPLPTTVFPVFTDDSSNATAAPKQKRAKKSPSLKTTVLISAQTLRSRWIKLPFPAQAATIVAGFGALLLLGVILFFRDGKAVVKVSIDTDEVEVTFNNEAIKLKDGTHDYEIKPGPHTLHIKSGNVEFDTDTFAVKKGGNPAVTVELIKSEIVARLGDTTIGRRKLTDDWIVRQSRTGVSDEKGPSSVTPPVPLAGAMPFDSSQLKPGDLRVITVEGIETFWRWIPAGKFKMGSPSAEKARSDDEDQQDVTISKGFWMLETEVTQELWSAVMGSALNWDSQHGLGAKYPAYRSSYEDAMAFCTKFNALLKTVPGAVELEVRLPTEAEWEYSARAGTTTRYYWGDRDEDADQYEWHEGNSKGSAQPVGQKKENAWGLKDMSGNVLEWCADWYTGKLPGGTDPRVPSSRVSARVFRGGGWGNSVGSGDLRSALRNLNTPETRFNILGFRVACSSVAIEKGPSSVTSPVPLAGAMPFDSSQLKPGDLRVITVKGIETRWRWIPAGKFKMGSPLAEKDRGSDEDQQDVTISKGFWMLETEVTQELWSAVMGSALNWESRYGLGAQYPAYSSSYEDAMAFCTTFSALLKTVPGAVELAVRLPTEAEWEYSARAGTTTRYYWGDQDEDADKYAWHYGNSKISTHPVGQKRENAWGLKDMSGNVWEWCADWYTWKLLGGTDPRGPSSGASGRVLRGGCWRISVGDGVLRSAVRNWNSPVDRSGSLGFRLACSSVGAEPSPAK